MSPLRAFFLSLFALLWQTSVLSAEPIRVVHPPLSFEIPSSDPSITMVLAPSIIPAEDREPFFLDSPPRLVLDLFGVEVKTSKNFDVEHPSVTKIRIGRHPEKTRVVFNLKKDQEYAFQKNRLPEGAIQVSVTPAWLLEKEKEALPTPAPPTPIEDEVIEQEEASAAPQIVSETGLASDLENDTTLHLLLFLFVLVLFTLIGLTALRRRETDEEESANETDVFTIDFLDPYEVLGCPADATDQEIRARYRKLVKAFHGDTLASHDLPEEVRELTQHQIRKVKAAYEQILIERKA